MKVFAEEEKGNCVRWGGFWRESVICRVKKLYRESVICRVKKLYRESVVQKS